MCNCRGERVTEKSQERWSQCQAETVIERILAAEQTERVGWRMSRE